MSRVKVLLLFAVGVLLGFCVRVGADQAALAAIRQERDDYREAAQMLLYEMQRIIDSRYSHDGADEDAMKHKTSELEGALLDAAVAKAEGMIEPWASAIATGEEGRFAYSQDWSLAGPIIERERINLLDNGIEWFAGTIIEQWQVEHGIGIRGPTPLIAAMRAYVASKFGEEVELP